MAPIRAVARMRQYSSSVLARAAVVSPSHEAPREEEEHVSTTPWPVPWGLDTVLKVLVVWMVPSMVLGSFFVPQGKDRLKRQAPERHPNDRSLRRGPRGRGGLGAPCPGNHAPLAGPIRGKPVPGFWALGASPHLALPSPRWSSPWGP